MARASAQNDIDDGRVHITYDVETNGSMVKEELPFVISVIAPFTGTENPEKPQPPLRERTFKVVDSNTIDAFMHEISPILDIRVPDVSGPEGTLLDVHLEFHSRADFKPGRIAEQIDPLNKKIRQRQLLNDLLAKLENNPRFQSSLEAILQETESKRRALKETGET